MSQTVDLSDMTFQEEYGIIPVRLLRVMRRVQFHPADYDLLVALDFNFQEMYQHITSHIVNGHYQYPLACDRMNP